MENLKKTSVLQPVVVRRAQTGQSSFVPWVNTMKNRTGKLNFFLESLNSMRIAKDSLVLLLYCG